MSPYPLPNAQWCTVRVDARSQNARLDYIMDPRLSTEYTEMTIMSAHWVEVPIKFDFDPSCEFQGKLIHAQKRRQFLLGDRRSVQPTGVFERT